MRRAFACFVVGVSLVVVGTSCGTVRCTEDMRCWDCHTMGNRICGGAR